VTDFDDGVAAEHPPYIPAYMRFADVLRDHIELGIYGPGEELPTEGALAHAHNVGRDVVRQALSVLRGEGIVTTRRGLPSRVRPSLGARRDPKRTIFLGAADTLTGRMPTRAERVSLGLEEGVPIIEVHRADGQIDLYPGDEFRVAVSADA
jgi:GntR family transcriptional regulator